MNTLLRLLSVRTLILGAAALLLGASSRAATYQPHVMVGSYPASAYAGTLVTVPVRLGYQDRAKGNRWFWLGSRTLVVDGSIDGGVQHVPITLGEVRTDPDGNARVQFIMPSRLVNRAGRSVGTRIALHVRFLGELPTFRRTAENRTISVIVRQ